MGFATTDDGCEIYYETHGSGSRPTLVFVSGYMGIANIWQSLIARLSSKYHCIAYDNRGYGRSSKPDSPDAYSIPRHAMDLAAVLTALKIDRRMALVTHSMGGNIASAYYLANPQNVSGIIYTETFYDGKLAQGRFLTFDALTHGVDEPSKCVEFYTSMGLDESIAIEAAKWPAYARRYNARALLGFEIGDGYSRITVPSLVVNGDGKAACPLDEVVMPIVRALPSCRLEVLKGINHFPQTEAPEELEKLIDGFVQALS